MIAAPSSVDSNLSCAIYADKNINISGGGTLNVTAGKVIAAVLVGAAILAGQIYVHKMQQEKRRKKR